MTLIKSILLGSAAGIVAVASAQAADLPTKKAAPVEQYVKICNVGGITGWTLPGSDTCVKLSGYITAQFVGGNLNTQYNQAGYASVYNALPAGTDPVLAGSSLLCSPCLGRHRRRQRTADRRLLVAAHSHRRPATRRRTRTFYRNATGWSMRSNFGFDFASNTAYGPLIGHFDFQADLGNGLDPLNGSTSTNSAVYANTAYLTWAGITAGKAASFYSFTGGGDNWANFFSPDQKGFNEPILMAYTSSFGGGFSATLAAQSPGTNGFSGGGTPVCASRRHLRRPALARHRRRVARQAGLGRGAGVRRPPQCQRRVLGLPGLGWRPRLRHCGGRARQLQRQAAEDGLGY